MTLFSSMLMLATIAALGNVLSAMPQIGLVVNTTAGPVQGKASPYAQDILSFTGIYFAESTAGDNRFMSPVPKAPWGPTVFDATKTPPGCPQQCELPPHTCPEVISEDCLALNVFAPSSEPSDGDARSVMVFIHGGDFRQGFGGGILYDGSRLAQHGDVVVVTMNYRLGVHGFLTSNNDVLGNFGIEDQRLAIQWVSKNIAAFGGDPAKVTLFGQSAGAVSVGIHVASAQTKGLFRAAIIESNPYSLPLRDQKSATALGDDVFKKANCFNDSPDIECLRKLPSDELTQIGLKAGKDLAHNTHILTIAMSWAPWVGPQSTALTQHPFKELSEKGASVPLMVGTLTQEGVIFIYSATKQPVNKIEYGALLTAVFGIGQGVEKQYPPVDGDNRDLTAVMATDYIFRCPNKNLSTVLDAVHPVYLYEFAKNISFGKAAWGPNFTYCDDKVCHGEELVYVFNVDGLIDSVKFTASEHAVAERVMTRWTNFAKNLDPNPPPGTDSGPQWPRVGGQGNIYTIDDQDTAASSAAGGKCTFWDTKGYAFP
eukprot:m.155035 g.155035  ORF g.155035 m.155035 type:complete len:541 (-) comp30921_c1_seq1:173-1795(-)